VVTPSDAIVAINVDVILLLIGMMVLVSGLDLCGFFDLVSSRMRTLAKRPGLVPGMANGHDGKRCLHSF